MKMANKHTKGSPHQDHQGNVNENNEILLHIYENGQNMEQ